MKGWFKASMLLRRGRAWNDAPPVDEQLVLDGGA